LVYGILMAASLRGSRFSSQSDLVVARCFKRVSFCVARVRYWRRFQPVDATLWSEVIA